MTEGGNEVRALVPPVFLFDDDDWLTVYDSVEAAQDGVEWAFADEVRAAFDSRGRSLSVSCQDDTVKLTLEELSSPQELQEAVARFYASWMSVPPPPMSRDWEVYLGKVLASYRGSSPRRRRRRRK